MKLLNRQYLHSNLHFSGISRVAAGLMILALLLGVAACTSTVQIAEEEQETAPKKEQRTTDKEISRKEIDYTRYRSYLKDLHQKPSYTIPEGFAYRDTINQKNDNENPLDGYRIQLLSTRKVNYADSVAQQFANWYNSQKLDSLLGYTPQSYVFFKQPYYRVHIGDFSNHQSAIGFAQIVKRRYPDAWVVHDRIKPANTPADSVSYRLVNR